jgi:hypothetical protein
VIDVQFADAGPLNGTWQKQGAFGGCNGNGMVNILATRYWRLGNSFCRLKIGHARRYKTPVGYAQNPLRHFV